jgi:hypothetical protein
VNADIAFSWQNLLLNRSEVLTINIPVHAGVRSPPTLTVTLPESGSITVDDEDLMVFSGDVRSKLAKVISASALLRRKGSQYKEAIALTDKHSFIAEFYGRDLDVQGGDNQVALTAIDRHGHASVSEVFNIKVASGRVAAITRTPRGTRTITLNATPTVSHTPIETASNAFDATDGLNASLSSAQYTPEYHPTGDDYAANLRL